MNEDLEALAAKLRAANPGATYVVDGSTLWLREGDRDLGLVSRLVTGELCGCIHPDGWTPIHRATPDTGGADET